MPVLLSDLLKQATKKNHQELEKAMVRQLRLIKTNEEYIKLLQLFYSYFGALEDKITRYILADEPGDDFQRRKASRLINDIEALGGAVREKAQKDDLPQINNHLQAFGALYVIEGSTLGGRVIVKMLLRQMNTGNSPGFTFFSGYGDETEKRWTSFKELLNLQPQNAREREQITVAADETFAKFKLWFDKNYV